MTIAEALKAEGITDGLTECIEAKEAAVVNIANISPQTLSRLKKQNQPI